MGLFIKGRNHTQSTSSSNIQELFQNQDEDALSVTGGIYLTHSRDGRPALGRKRPNKILQDFGFDILGQSFGVPSRSDYKRRARPQSYTSQSSGLVTMPGTPRPVWEPQELDRGRKVHTYENTNHPPIHCRTDRAHLRSPYAPISAVQHDNQGIPGLWQGAAYGRSCSSTGPRTLSQHCGLPPPPPPPPSSVVGWHYHPGDNVGAVPISRGYNMTPPHHACPPYPCGGTQASQSAPSGTSLQHGMIALGSVLPQPTVRPVLPPLLPPILASPLSFSHYSNRPQPTLLPHVQATWTTSPVNLPPPPPLPPLPPSQYQLQAYATRTRQGNVSQQNTNYVKSTEKLAGQANQAGNSLEDAKRAHAEAKQSEDVRQSLGKRIQHVHVCAGCGKKRSARYQQAHPLKRGELPPLNYCYSCLLNAADSGSEGSGADVAVEYPFPQKVHTKPTGYRPQPVSASNVQQDRRKVSLPWLRSNENHTIADGAEQRYHELGLRRAVLRFLNFDRAGAPKRVDSGAFQEGAETPTRFQQKYPRVDLWNAKHHSPAIPMPPSNNEPTLSRPRTRIRRPQPQPEIVDVDSSLPVDADADADVPMLVLDREGSLPRSGANDPAYAPNSAQARDMPEQTAGLQQFSGSGDFVCCPVRNTVPELADNFGENGPLTPTDLPYASNSQLPCTVRDLLWDYQTSMEREVEEMAERDLASAGKLFDSLSESLGGSATSTCPITSVITTSNMSIVSYNSDSDDGGNDTAAAGTREAKLGKNVEDVGAIKPTRRLEYSSEEERQQKITTSKSRNESSTAYLEHSDRCIAKNPRSLSPRKKMNNEVYNEYGGNQVDDNDVDSFPSPILSSLIGHTGHSVDDLEEEYVPVYQGPATTAKHHRMRRFLRRSSD
ncbi:hypothetical protein NUW58_g1659 [Xylaria curta]|uniref:Uncharacterized protein n=1 Tax=Xylaria curta TaxID=42375 RepID=A0ACC1PJA9_9PEZI|nr:hypothetical protein NUW58_g1659 [Xylaria curta]